MSKPITTVTEVLEANGNTNYDADQMVVVITAVRKGGNETAEVPASDAYVMANEMEFYGSLYSRETAIARKAVLEEMEQDERTHFMPLKKRMEIEANREKREADTLTKLEASFPLTPDADNFLTQEKIANMEDVDYASEIMAGAPQNAIDGFCDALEVASEAWEQCKADNGFLPRNKHMAELERFLRELKGSPHARQVLVELSFTDRETNERTYGYWSVPWALRKEAVAIGNKANTDEYSIWCSGYRSVAAVKIDAEFQQDLNEQLAERDPSKATAAKARREELLAQNDGMAADLERVMGQDAAKAARKAKLSRPLKQRLGDKLKDALGTEG